MILKLKNTKFTNIFISNIDINKIIVSNKGHFWEKGF